MKMNYLENFSQSIPLINRSAIITGASKGLGKSIAKEFVKAGANVMICARNLEDLKSTHQLLIDNLVHEQQLIIFQQTDISNEDETQQLIHKAIKQFKTVQILVNNAGIYGPKGNLEDQKSQDWLDAININLFGSVFMCKNILPHFKSNNYGKIIQISGGGATSPLPRFSAYAASKAGVIRFAETLAEETRDFNIDVNMIAPGALNTHMLDEVFVAGPEIVGDKFFKKAMKQKESGGVPLELGARLAVYLGSNISDGITGKLISAVWDDWENLHQYKNELSASDIYTLRRIVPKDRGYSWGEK